MNLPTIMVLAAVGICTALALRSIFRNIKKRELLQRVRKCLRRELRSLQRSRLREQKKEYESETNTSGKE